MGIDLLKRAFIQLVWEPFHILILLKPVRLADREREGTLNDLIASMAKEMFENAV